MPDKIDTAYLRSLAEGKRRVNVTLSVPYVRAIADELDRLRAEIDRLNHEDNFDFFHISEKRIKELERQLADANKRIAELEAENAELTARLNEADWSEVGD